MRISLPLCTLLAAFSANAYESERAEDRFNGTVTVRAPSKKEHAARGMGAGDPAISIVATSKDSGKKWTYSIAAMATATTNVVAICDSMIMLVDGKRIQFPKGLNSVMRGPGGYSAIVTFPIDKAGVQRLVKAKKVEAQFCNREFVIDDEWKITWADIPT